jgi:hypothetical protein
VSTAIGKNLPTGKFQKAAQEQDKIDIWRTTGIQDFYARALLTPACAIG